MANKKNYKKSPKNIGGSNLFICPKSTLFGPKVAKTLCFHEGHSLFFILYSIQPDYPYKRFILWYYSKGNNSALKG